ncbi:radical SAM family heme chaperone HemW [Lacihabitans sp. CS3-21]|uniref:radical SAM family heme chaperone HemW n=1 Tax=Lacihabitans sp. CS3-21 TaxID=2487332 RepID=UPI0020CE362D|nr:radical SAM family heme chaperone HemW [Lacihabitans sp. CS3-21]MCP9745850.1 radical SAM family heme chaperone HemW [Lacihabitans sp. CS3-21]
MHLYIHIPFCKQACYYCDFHFSTNLSLKDKMVDAICTEIELQKEYLKKKKLQTIYFGGGTPSLLTGGDFEKIFFAISKFYDVSSLEETTIETNPDDINLEKISDWKSFGIDRVSLGIQTFDNDLLKFMNRAHDSHQSKLALDLLLNNNLENITIDLIYAKNAKKFDIEKQNNILKNDLEIIEKYNLNHISAYNLTIEESTVFGKWVKQKKLEPIGEDYAAEQYDILVNNLTGHGFEQYEVSNFAKSGNYALHNSAYWKNEEYLGIGPSAHSYNLASRQANISNNSKYIASIDLGNIPFSIENLSISDKINDYLLCGLRTIWGIDTKKISQIVGEIPQTFWNTLNILKNQNLVVQSGNSIKITSKGRIFSDRIASDLFFD